MCAKVKMLPAIDVTVNCTLVLIKHKYSNCIHYRIPLELLLEANCGTSDTENDRLTGKSIRHGMVRNSVRRLATSLQPGSTLEGVESSGQLFYDHAVKFNDMVNSVVKYYLITEVILLTLRDILFYTFKLVLNTPLEAAYSTPVSSAFFTSKDYPLCSSGEQKYNTRKGNIAGRLLAVFKHSNNPTHLNNGPLNKLGESHHG